MTRSQLNIKTISFLLFFLLQGAVSSAQKGKVVTIVANDDGECTINNNRPSSDEECNNHWVKYGAIVKTRINNVNSIKLRASSKIEVKDFDFENPSIFMGALQASKGKNDNDKQLSPQSFNPDESPHTKFERVYGNYQRIYADIREKNELTDWLETLVSDEIIFIPDCDVLKNKSRQWYNLSYDGNIRPEIASNSIFEDFNKIDEQYTLLSEIYRELSTLSKANNTIRDSTDCSNNYEEIFKKIKSIHEKIMASQTDIKAKSISGVHLFMDIQSSSCSIEEDNGMIITDQMTIVPVLKDLKGNIAHEFKPTILRSYGHLKVNASAGFLLSFVGDENYGLVKDLEGNSIGVKRQGSSVLNPSVGSLINAYYQLKYDLSAGVSAGISLDSETNAGFYLGISALAFSKNRLVLTTGISYTKQKFLNDANPTPAIDQGSGEHIPGRMDFVSPIDTEINYDKLYKPSLFVGITYNLINKN